jgi:intergrase/recombinase
VNGEPFEFNDLRHSFATWLASAGVPKETRDRLMGRAAASVGERHYTATDVQLLQAGGRDDPA